MPEYQRDRGCIVLLYTTKKLPTKAAWYNAFSDNMTLGTQFPLTINAASPQLDVFRVLSPHFLYLTNSRLLNQGRSARGSATVIWSARRDL